MTVILNFTKKKIAINPQVAGSIPAVYFNTSASNDRMVNMKTVFLTGFAAALLIIIVAKSIFIGTLARILVNLLFTCINLAPTMYLLNNAKKFYTALGLVKEMMIK